MKLTDPVIKATKPQEKPFTLSDGEGLALHIQPNGSKWWRFRYRFDGKPCFLSLGTYPSTDIQEIYGQRQLCNNFRTSPCKNSDDMKS